jgi:hypothetical protein
MLFSTIWRAKSPGDSSEGSLLFAIAQALADVRQGSIDDEALALHANRMVRRRLDKHAITYKDYRVWRKRNPLIFTTILTQSNELVGFFDIFPLTTEAGEGIISGRLTERSLTPEHVVPLADSKSATHIHVATILVNPRQRTYNPVVAKEIIIMKLREFMATNYAPVETRTYTAYAQSKTGEALLKRCGFSMAVLARDNEQRFPLYVLRPGETVAAVFRFERVEECFSRKLILLHLDARISEIELRLRTAIASGLNNDPSLLPPQISQKAKQRIEAAIRKTASREPHYKLLQTKLEFCDLLDLQAPIVGKHLWVKFQPFFSTQELLASKLNQLAELRNSIRHSRTVDEVTNKEGEAAIIWFERILNSMKDDNRPFA